MLRVSELTGPSKSQFHAPINTAFRSRLYFYHCGIRERNRYFGALEEFTGWRAVDRRRQRPTGWDGDLGGRKRCALFTYERQRWVWRRLQRGRQTR